jgi:chemotaxis protein methyltransferase CheR
VKAEEIAQLVSLCRARAGLKLAPDKTYVMETRLAPVARREGYDSISALLEAIRARREDPLVWAVVEALAGGETAFFRDREPFALFRDEIVPQLARLRAGGPIKVWSAACATGQEIYSLSMLLGELLEIDPGLRVELAASDLSRIALERAQSGLYNQFEIQRGLPIRLVVRHFEKADEMWALSPRIRQMVRWRRINLLADLRPLGAFDVIFCRYLIRELDADTRQRVLGQLARALPPDGRLVLGLDEAAEGITEALQPVPDQPGLFRPNPAFREAA